MARAWRLLVDGDAPGTFNMGVDEALFGTAAATGTPTLRFYGWQGPWLSIGYAQSLTPERLAELSSAGVGWVRRVTGGRAVLHGADLTYSIAAPAGALPDGVRPSYSIVADALLAALEGLGVPANRSDPDASAPGSTVFDCFAEPAADEICLGGRKLSGSAQRRVEGALLQHGSIRLRADDAHAVRAVAGEVGGLGGTSLLEEGISLSRQALERACAESFETVLGIRLEPGDLTPAELDRARTRGPEPGGDLRLGDAPGAPITPNTRGKPPQESPSSTR